MPPMTSITKKKTSMATFKASKNRLDLVEASEVDDYKLKPEFINHSKTTVPIRVMLNLPCLSSIKETTKPGWQHICLQYGY